MYIHSNAHFLLYERVRYGWQRTQFSSSYSFVFASVRFGFRSSSFAVYTNEHEQPNCFENIMHSSLNYHLQPPPPPHSSSDFEYLGSNINLHFWKFLSREPPPSPRILSVHTYVPSTQKKILLINSSVVQRKHVRCVFTTIKEATSTQNKQ